MVKLSITLKLTLDKRVVTNQFGIQHTYVDLMSWITDLQNPLTARVAVNHIWTRHFGKPLVTTVFDFGRKGNAPLNPELLDWLATELVAQKWDVKEFIKLLVTSAAYRQSSRVPAALQERDPDNLLLARGPRFRAAAEVVRDQALAISGLLSQKMYGPPVRPPGPAVAVPAAPARGARPPRVTPPRSPPRSPASPPRRHSPAL